MATPTRTPGGDRRRSFEVEWMTFSYRMIAFYVGLALLLVGFVVYLISPAGDPNSFRQLTKVGGRGWTSFDFGSP